MHSYDTFCNSNYYHVSFQMALLPCLNATNGDTSTLKRIISSFLLRKASSGILTPRVGVVRVVLWNTWLCIFPMAFLVAEFVIAWTQIPSEELARRDNYVVCCFFILSKQIWLRQNIPYYGQLLSIRNTFSYYANIPHYATIPPRKNIPYYVKLAHYAKVSLLRDVFRTAWKRCVIFSLRRKTTCVT